MPDRQQASTAIGHVPGDQSVQLVLRPVLGEERRREDDKTEAASRNARVDRSTQAIPDTKLEFVVPDIDASSLKRVCEWANHPILVFGCVRDEDVELAVLESIVRQLIGKADQWRVGRQVGRGSTGAAGPGSTTARSPSRPG